MSRWCTIASDDHWGHAHPGTPAPSYLPRLCCIPLSPLPSDGEPSVYNSICTRLQIVLLSLFQSLAETAGLTLGDSSREELCGGIVSYVSQSFPILQRVPAIFSHRQSQPPPQLRVCPSLSAPTWLHLLKVRHLSFSTSCLFKLSQISNIQNFAISYIKDMDLFFFNPRLIQFFLY